MSSVIVVIVVLIVVMLVDWMLKPSESMALLFYLRAMKLPVC